MEKKKMSYRNPLTSHAVDGVVNELSSILASDPADAAAVISALQTYLRDPARENEVIKQTANLYRMVRLTSAADSAVIDDVLGQL